MNADIVDIDVTELVDGTLVHKGGQPLTTDAQDKEPVRGDSFEVLGLWACCAPADDRGKCEALKLSDVGGLNEVIVGRRDTRFGAKLGKADPGDTGIASTDPDTDVQFRCHGKRKQAVFFARKGGPTSEMAMVMIDAEEKSFQFLGFGGVLKYSESDGWAMLDKGAGFTIKNGMMQFYCQGKLTQNPAALPLRMGQAPIGGAPIPGWFGIVAHLWAWLKWWIWKRLPVLPDSERETA